MNVTIETFTYLERVVPVRIPVTPGQRQALLVVLETVPDETLLAVHGFTATFSMADPIGWLEARMAEHPRGTFPRARLHGVLRKLSQAIQGQVEPDPSDGQAQPDLGSPDGV